MNDPLIEELIERKMAKCSIIIESPSTVYRFNQDIGREGENIILSTDDLGGTIEVSAYIYCVEDRVSYRSDSFLPIYDGYEFELSKYDIIAIDDGYTFTIDHDFGNINNSSIFMLLKTDDEKVSYKYTSEKIQILIPEEQYNQYSSRLRDSVISKNILLSGIVTPVLVSIFNTISYDEDNEEGMLERLSELRWFRSILYSYKEEMGEDLTEAILEDAKANGFFELTQKILNNCIKNVFMDLYNLSEIDEGE